MYLTKADELLKDLQAAIEVGAAEEVKRLAHRLAGSSVVCGVTAMVQPLRALEQRGREGQIVRRRPVARPDGPSGWKCADASLAEYLAEKSR